MQQCMGEKIRFVLVVDEEIRAALRLEAANRTAARSDGEEVEMSEIIEDLVREHLSDSITEVRRRRALGSDRKRKS